MHCTCVGPEVQSLVDGPYKDINPSCNLCQGYSMNYVPKFRSTLTVETEGFGNQNCLGLYEAALTGNVLSSEACQEIHDVYEDCCSLPDLPGQTGNGSNGSYNPSGVPSDSFHTSGLKNNIWCVGLLVGYWCWALSMLM